MILELFALLIAISLYMVWLGFRVEVPAYSTVGFFFVFLLSLVLIANQLQVQVGANITDYGNMTTNVANVYQYYTDDSSHYIGYFMAVASSVGMFLSFFQQKKGSIKK